MQKLKTAIIGCGNIFPVHADVLKNLADVELTYVVDNQKSRAKAAASKYNCSYLTDYRKLFNLQLDVVHVCTPHYLHLPMTADLLEHNLNVLLEKPLTLNYQTGCQLAQLAAGSSSKLGVVFQNRFNPNNQKAKQLLSRGELGKIKGIKGFVTWHRDKNYYLQDSWRGSYQTEGGGVLINQAIHTLDLMQWFVGDVAELKASIDTRLLQNIIEVEDTAEATLYFVNGAVGIFYATNTFTSNSPVEIVIDCEKASLQLVGNRLLKIESGIVEELQIQAEKEPANYKSYWGNSHQKIISGFYKDIKLGTEKYIINAESAVKSLQIIDAIYQSAHQNRRIVLK